MPGQELPVRAYDRTRLLPYYMEMAQRAEQAEQQAQAMAMSQQERANMREQANLGARGARKRAEEERTNMFAWAENAAKRARPGWNSGFNTTSAPVSSAELAPWIAMYQGKTDGVPMVGGGIRVMGGGGGGYDEREMPSEERRMVAAKADLMEEQARAAAIQRQLAPHERSVEQVRYDDHMGMNRDAIAGQTMVGLERARVDEAKAQQAVAEKEKDRQNRLEVERIRDKRAQASSKGKGGGDLVGNIMSAAFAAGDKPQASATPGKDESKGGAVQDGPPDQLEAMAEARFPGMGMAEVRRLRASGLDDDEIMRRIQRAGGK